jgi:hypothetical protein
MINATFFTLESIEDKITGFEEKARKLRITSGKRIDL